jgi:hypothetical protein
MLVRGYTAKPRGSVDYPYTWAFRRELKSKGILNRGGGSEAEDGVLGHHAACARSQTARQHQVWVLRAQHPGSAMNLECNRLLDSGAAAFLAGTSSTVGDLVEYTQLHHNPHTPTIYRVSSGQPSGNSACQSGCMRVCSLEVCCCGSKWDLWSNIL